MERSSSFYVTTLPRLVGIGIVVVEIKLFLIYRVTSCDHLLKGFCVLKDLSFL